MSAERFSLELGKPERVGERQVADLLGGNILPFNGTNVPIPLYLLGRK